MCNLNVIILCLKLSENVKKPYHLSVKVFPSVIIYVTGKNVIQITFDYILRFAHIVSFYLVAQYAISIFRKFSSVQLWLFSVKLSLYPEKDLSTSTDVTGQNLRTEVSIAGTCSGTSIQVIIQATLYS